MDLTLFATFLAACLAAGATGMMFQPGDWYRTLSKPDWTPPDWVFPVTWTVLYLLMSAAAARIAGLPDTGRPLAFWSLQIALNTLWTPVFFGLQRMFAGLVIIVFLWLAVAATLVSFWMHDGIAAIMFAPYLVWVTIAAALNLSVWRRNRPAAAA